MQTGREIDVYNCNIELIPQRIHVGNREYDLEWRFERGYKNYTMTLKDVRFDKYVGTKDKAKNYSSLVRLVDDKQHVDRDVLIWMNNPLRFSGETFYQSSFNVDHVGEATVFQVVRNQGWMIPYVSCMLVAIGMLAHFGNAASRFVRGRSDER